MTFHWREVSWDILIGVLIYLFIWYGHYPKTKRDYLYLPLIYGSFWAILFFTLFPIIGSLSSLFSASYDINWIPFVDVVKERPNAYLEIYLNILLFIPFAFFYVRYTRKKPGKFFLLALGIATAIELLQPALSPFRTADITDIITNTFGAMIGYALAKVSLKDE